MMLFKGQKGFEDMIEEASRNPKFFEDSEENKGRLITTIYIGVDYYYKIVKDKELGDYCSVTKNFINKSPTLYGMMI